MISLNFGLWHSGVKLSYLRYLTFKTLRHFHPHSRIQLFIGDKYKNEGHKWNNEKQDFETPSDIKKDYLGELEKLNIEIKHVDWFSQYASNYQSDIFRYWYLNNFSGFYLDTDQIILKSFETLPLDNDFIFSCYKADSCGIYTPVGVLGASKESKVVPYIMNELPKFVDVNNYNSAGPFMLRQVLSSRPWKEKMFNAPSHYFYPVPESFGVSEIYDGKLIIPEDSYSLHLFLGHPLSQEFNKKYNEEFAKKSNDTISALVRETGLM